MISARSEFEVKKTFAFYLLGVMIIFIGHYPLLNLQSSLNVQDGLGTTALTVSYSLNLVFGLFGSAIVLQFISIKSGLLFFDFVAVIYCAVNFYPKIYTLIPASALIGIGKSFYWICSGAFIVYFAKCFEKLSNDTTRGYVSIVNGCTFASMHAAQIIGNLISFIVFETTANEQEDNPANSTVTESTTEYTQKSNTRPPISEICGAKDCQDPAITKLTIAKYVPPDPITLYIVLSVFLALSVIGLILHAVFLPSGEEEKTKFPTEDGHSNVAYIEDEVSRENTFKNDAKKNIEENSISSERSSHEGFHKRKLVEVLQEYKKTLYHFIKPYQLLLMGLQFHTGLSRSFAFSEITRSYVSCVYGVSKVGIAMSIYGAFNFITALVCGKVSGKFGRKIPVAVGFVLNLTSYVICLIWVPNENSSVWVAYGLVMLLGLCDAIWLNIITESIPAFFPEESKRGFICLMVFRTVSFLVQFGWSTSVCVNYKIFALIASLSLSVTAQMIAEHKLAKARSEDQPSDVMKANTGNEK